MIVLCLEVKLARNTENSKSRQLKIQLSKLLNLYIATHKGGKHRASLVDEDTTFNLLTTPIGLAVYFMIRISVYGKRFQAIASFHSNKENYSNLYIALVVINRYSACHTQMTSSISGDTVLLTCRRCVDTAQLKNKLIYRSFATDLSC